jgi:hypothetical protein
MAVRPALARRMIGYDYRMMSQRDYYVATVMGGVRTGIRLNPHVRFDAHGAAFDRYLGIDCPRDAGRLPAVRTIVFGQRDGWYRVDFAKSACIPLTANADRHFICNAMSMTGNGSVL